MRQKGGGSICHVSRAAVVIFSSITHPISLTLLYLSAACLRGFSLDRSEMPPTGSAASERRLATQTIIRRPQLRPSPADSRPQPARNPPAAPSGSGDRPVAP